MMGSSKIAMATWPLHIVLATSGSIAVLAASRILSRFVVADVLDVLGKSSLVIYLMQLALLHLLLAAVRGALNDANLESSIVIMFAVVSTTLCVGCLIAQVLRKTRMRWVLGF